MDRHTFKTCKNKGNDRIWIEGQRLTNATWRQGNQFNRVVYQLRGAIVLTRAMNGCSGTHRVAGTLERPIIDLCGKWVTEFMQGATNYTVNFERDTITIERA